MATVAKFTWTGVKFLNKSIVDGGSRGGGSVVSPSFMAVGTGSSASATVTDTALQTELTSGVIGVSYARASAVISAICIAQDSDTLQGVATYTLPGGATASPTISEVGWYDSLAAVTNMWFRATFTGIQLSPGFGLQATMQAQMTTS